MAEEKSARSSAEEGKAQAEGDLTEQNAALADATAQLNTARSSCMTTAADHEASMKARDEELSVIAQAKKILVETSEGAVSQTYSFVQVVSLLRTRADLANSEVSAQ